MILFSPNEWNAPRSLSDLFEAYDPRLAPFIQDYHINVIAPSEIEDYDKFRSALGPMMELIKYSTNKNALKDLLARKRSVYANLDPDTARMLGKYTNIDLKELNDSTTGLRIFNAGLLNRAAFRSVNHAMIKAFFSAVYILKSRIISSPGSLLPS